MFQMYYPTDSIPEFATDDHNYVASLAEIWELVHSHASWIDKPFYVDGKLFATRVEYRDFYKLQHEKYFIK